MVVSNYPSLLNYDYFDKLLRLEKVKLFSRQDKILYILETFTILILYRNLYINIVPIIGLKIEATQYNIKINLAISCSPKRMIFLPLSYLSSVAFLLQSLAVYKKNSDLLLPNHRL